MLDISVLLIGAFGKPLLDELIRQKAQFTHLAILATADRASKFSDSGVEVISGSLYAPESYTGFTHVISAVGNALMILQPAMIEATIAAGVQHFYASKWNTDIAQREIQNIRYFRDKSVRICVPKPPKPPGFNTHSW